MDFNPSSSKVMHIDLNSCFATVEQQANPLLRGKPLVVAAYDSPGGCILASSVEAKKYGIKTGMRVKDGKKLYPSLIVLSPDPAKYRNVHLRLRKILKKYTNFFEPKSIDEFVLNFDGYPAYDLGLVNIANEIKETIKKNIGEWIRVSVGIAPNRFLAKTASSLHKPDGLDLIDKNNFLEVYSKLTLKDLNGIDVKNEMRLRRIGITNVVEFYQADIWKLKVAFSSINGYYWFLRLRGWEIDAIEPTRRSFGNSYAIPHSEGEIDELLPILQKLCEKTGSRLRKAGYKAFGIHVSLVLKNHSYWHKGESFQKELFDSRDIYKEAKRILTTCESLSPVHTLAVSCFNLARNYSLQLGLLEDVVKKDNLVVSQDKLNKRWGDFTLTPGRMLLVKDKVLDRIAFGGVREL